jgi:DNA-binding CsgD family transcriptional regulator
MDKGYLDSILKNCQEVDVICAPIFSSLQTKAFSFCRAYKDGGRVYFCNFSDWGEHVIKNDYLNTFSFKQEPVFEKVSLWKFWPKQDRKYRQLIQDAEQSFSQNSGIALTHHYENHSDFFSLRGYSAHSVYEANACYLNNLELIRRFTGYFLSKIDPLLRSAQKDQLLYSQHQSCLPIQGHQPESDTNHGYKELLSVFSQTQIFCEGIHVTPRQVECIVYMMLGKSSKEIARDLCISQRTVEAHISHLKSKLNVSFKSAVIEKILCLPENKRIILDRLNEILVGSRR